METDKLKNGVVGAILGASMMFGLASGGDIDPLTDLPYETIVEQPGTDVYYTPLVSDVTNAMNNGSMSGLETARYSLDRSRVVLKYNAGEIDRRFSEARLGDGYTHEQILSILEGPEWAVEE